MALVGTIVRRPVRALVLTSPRQVPRHGSQRLWGNFRALMARVLHRTWWRGTKKGTRMNRLITIGSILVLGLSAAACNQAKSPATEQRDVSKAEADRNA